MARFSLCLQLVVVLILSAQPCSAGGLALPLVDHCDGDLPGQWKIEDAQLSKWFVASDPDLPDNRVYKARLDAPGSASASLLGSENLGACVFSARVRLAKGRKANWTVLAVVRSGAGYYLRLGLNPGQNAIAEATAKTGHRILARASGPSIESGRWLRASIAVSGGFVFAKTWLEGSPEPPWESCAAVPDLRPGMIQIGLWSGADGVVEALFDDMEVRLPSAKDAQEFERLAMPVPVPDLGKARGECGVAEVGEFAVIQNEGLILAFHKQTGRIAGMADKKTGLDRWSNDARAPLFRLDLSKPAKAERLGFSSDAFGRLEVETTRRDDSAELLLRFSDCPYAEIVPVCRFSVARGSPLIEARMQVANSSDWAIRSVDFPCLSLANMIGEKSDEDEVLFPSMGGVMFKDPGATSPSAAAYFPGVASYQMAAYYDGAAGIYVATYDASGEVKRFRLAVEANHLDLTPGHFRPEVCGADFEDAYATVLAPIHAPWYNAADLYKEWAEKQFWCRTPLSDRHDLPDWLKSGPPFLWATTRLDQLGAVLRQDDPDGLIETIDRYRKTAGAKHIIFSNSGWEKQGTWAGIDYFPTFPPEEWWKAFSAQAKKHNIHIALMTSGFKWMVKRKAWANGPEIDYTEDWRRRSAMAITNPDGTPFLNDRQYERRDWVGAYSKVCRGCKAGQDVMTQIFVRLAQMGVSMSSFDQVLGGGEDTPCYHPDHDHPPGYGRWMWEKYRELHERILREAREVEPDFSLYQENEGELTIPYQGTTWARNYHILNHPHRGAWGVPVYPYLYHEHITCIGAALIYGLGASVGGSDPETHAYAMARNLVFGQLQGDFSQAILLNENGVPESVPSRAYFSFSRPLSDHSEFLILGKMKRSFSLACEETKLRMIPDRASVKGKPMPFEITMPAVLQGVFESPSGETGVILANGTARPQRCALTLPDPYPGKEDIVREFRKGVEVTAHSGAPNRQIAVSLDPFEPVFLRLD